MAIPLTSTLIFLKAETKAIVVILVVIIVVIQVRMVIEKNKNNNNNNNMLGTDSGATHRVEMTQLA